MVQPTKPRIVSNDPEARAGTTAPLRERNDEPVRVELSDDDVNRIAERVVKILDSRKSTLAPVEEDYISVRRNKADRPLSEY